MNSDNKITLAIFASVLIDLLGFTVILPLFPSLLDFYAKNKEVSYFKLSSMCFFLISQGAKFLKISELA